MKKIVTAHVENVGYVARVKEARKEETGAAIIKLHKPIERDGKVFRFCVEEARVISDMLTGQKSRELLREVYTETEAEARHALAEIVNASKGEHAKNIKQQRAVFDASEAARKALLGATPPTGGIKIWNLDLQDYDQAQANLLREKYPYTIKCFDAAREGKRLSEDELDKAYALDVAALTGAVSDGKVPGDKNFLVQLAKVLAPRKGTAGKRRAIATLRTEILRGWFSEKYCWMTNTERARVLNRKLGTQYSPAGIRMQIAALGITSKRGDGSPEK